MKKTYICPKVKSADMGMDACILLSTSGTNTGLDGTGFDGNTDESGVTEGDANRDYGWFDDEE